MCRCPSQRHRIHYLEGDELKRRQSSTKIHTLIMHTQSQLLGFIAHILRWTNLEQGSTTSAVNIASNKSGSQMYTVSPPIGGRKTLMSGRVMSSGYIPPVSSNSARRRSDSELGDVSIRLYESTPTSSLTFQTSRLHQEDTIRVRQQPCW